MNLFIDLNEAGLNLDKEELEAYTRRMVGDLKEGLAEDAVLVRAAEVPEGSKPAIAGFDIGILKAEVNLKNLKLLLDWLGERIYGRTLRIEYGDVKLEYRTPEQLEQQLGALEKISHLTVRVVKSETSKG